MHPKEEGLCLEPCVLPDRLQDAELEEEFVNFLKFEDLEDKICYIVGFACNEIINLNV